MPTVSEVIKSLQAMNPDAQICHITWEADDVQMVASNHYYSLTPQQVHDVLEKLQMQYDPEYGICWETIYSTIDNNVEGVRHEWEIARDWYLNACNVEIGNKELDASWKGKHKLAHYQYGADHSKLFHIFGGEDTMWMNEVIVYEDTFEDFEEAKARCEQLYDKHLNGCCDIVQIRDGELVRVAEYGVSMTEANWKIDLVNGLPVEVEAL
jgi:hypothetical protein